MNTILLTRQVYCPLISTDARYLRTLLFRLNRFLCIHFLSKVGASMESILTGVSVTLDMLVASVTAIMMIVVLLLVPMVSNTKLHSGAPLWV